MEYKLFKVLLNNWFYLYFIKFNLISNISLFFSKLVINVFVVFNVLFFRNSVVINENKLC